MERIRHYFGGIEMTWTRVIIFAIFAGVYTAVVNLIPVFQDTSFADIAINLEWWILFAVFIVVNCDKWWEASLKCFVFFLISQPLVYLIEVPFVSEGWGIFQYYHHWFIMTVLTLPGAAIAFLVKRKDWLSALVLLVPIGYFAYAVNMYERMAETRFPHHLLSAVFCVVLVLLFIFVFMEDKKKKLALLAAFVILTIGSYVYMNMAFGNGTGQIILDEGSWTCEIEDASIADITVEDGNVVNIMAKSDGTTMITLTDENGAEVYYYVTITGKNVFANEFVE